MVACGEGHRLDTCHFEKKMSAYVRTSHEEAPKPSCRFCNEDLCWRSLLKGVADSWPFLNKKRTKKHLGKESLRKGTTLRPPAQPLPRQPSFSLLPATLRTNADTAAQTLSPVVCLDRFMHVSCHIPQGNGCTETWSLLDCFQV